jgi:hypothetical protein
MLIPTPGESWLKTGHRRSDLGLRLLLRVRGGKDAAFVVNRAWLGAEGSASAVVWVDGVMLAE